VVLAQTFRGKLATLEQSRDDSNPPGGDDDDDDDDDEDSSDDDSDVSPLAAALGGIVADLFSE